MVALRCRMVCLNVFDIIEASSEAVSWMVRLSYNVVSFSTSRALSRCGKSRRPQH